MTKYVQNRITSFLEKRSFQNDDALYLFLTLLAAVGFAGVVHIALAVLFSYARMALMLWFTLASLVLDASCIALIFRCHYMVSGFILTTEVSCYTLLTVYFLGWGSYAIFYLLAVLLLQVTIPYAPKLARGMMICLLYISFFLILFMDFNRAPVHDLGNTQFILAFLNMNVGFFGTVAQFAIINATRNLIARYNERKLESYRVQAHTDPLTGLHNRRYAEMRFAEIAQAGQRSWCVAMMDIDDFKLVNDSFGHSTGDVVLRVLSDTMRETLRKTDVLIRWGGEEFLLLLADVDTRTASAILDKLRDTIGSTQIISGGNTISVTVTIGVAELDPHDVQSSINRCDEKLYEGKRQGKNVVAVA